MRNLRSVVLGIVLLCPFCIQAQDSLSRELRVIFPETCVSSGFADALNKVFESRYKIPVKMLTLCTGDAIHFVKEHAGTEEYDVMIGHNIEQEESFVKDGYAVNLRPVCYSDFVLVGPKNDPAKIKGMKDVLKALERIAAAKSNFCSKADSSGTYGLEMRLWKMAKISPKGDWYIETKTGTQATLTLAGKKQAYMICHWASFTQMAEKIDLAPLVEDSEKLKTNYDVLAINPEKFPKVHYISAMLFIGFLTSPDIQKFIGEFGMEKFHRPAFIPLAIKTNQQRKGEK